MFSFIAGVSEVENGLTDFKTSIDILANVMFYIENLYNKTSICHEGYLITG